MTNRPNEISSQPTPRSGRSRATLRSPTEALSGGGSLDLNDPKAMRRANMIQVFGEMSNAIAGGQRANITDMAFPTLRSLQGQGFNEETDGITGGVIDNFTPSEPKDFTRQNPIQPEDLGEAVGASGKIFQLQNVAAESWNAMTKAALADGINLNSDSALRSWDNQLRAYEDFIKTGRNQNNVVVPNILPPEKSLHVLGLAVDINGASKGSVVHNWLAANAARFGWTPISNEAWHWEFKGSKSFGGGSGGGGEDTSTPVGDASQPDPITTPAPAGPR